MNPLTRSEKEKILSRLFWDVEKNQMDLEKLLEEKIETIEDLQSQQFFCRLLTSCDWYTLLKLIPSGKLEFVLSDAVIDRLFPKDLKNKYIYARNLLSR
jgi:hypothetical protein